MENYIKGLAALVCTMLREAVKNPKAKAKLKSAVKSLYTVILSIYPEFAEE